MRAAEFLRKANQFGGFFILAGPADDELDDLRKLGYRPEATVKVEASRLAWEDTYTGLLADDPVSRAELRVRVQARELLHEHRRLLGELLAEYRINLARARPNRSRQRMIAFADRVPSLRIAVDLKTELFRNAARTWTMNAIFDIDALSLAVPYCHLVVPDAEMAHLLARTGVVVADLQPERLEQAAGDRVAWFPAPCHRSVGGGVVFACENTTRKPWWSSGRGWQG